MPWISPCVRSDTYLGTPTNLLSLCCLQGAVLRRGPFTAQRIFDTPVGASGLYCFCLESCCDTHSSSSMYVADTSQLPPDKIAYHNPACLLRIFITYCALCTYLSVLHPLSACFSFHGVIQAAHQDAQGDHFPAPDSADVCLYGARLMCRPGVRILTGPVIGEVTANSVVSIYSSYLVLVRHGLSYRTMWQYKSTVLVQFTYICTGCHGVSTYDMYAVSVTHRECQVVSCTSTTVAKLSVLT